MSSTGENNLGAPYNYPQDPIHVPPPSYRPSTPASAPSQTSTGNILDDGTGTNPRAEVGSGTGYSHTPPTSSRKSENTSKKIGLGGLIAAVSIAGLLGGGIGGGVVYAFNTAVGEAPTTTESGGDAINRQQSVAPVTQAAATASESVVTLAVNSTDGSGSGSGVILDTEGHILTNAHVATLGGATETAEISVQVADGQVYQAKLVGSDAQSDLAVVKITAENLTPIQLGSSNELNVGDQAIAIGAPLGLSGTVTEGIVSQLDRTISVASSEVPDQPEPGEGGTDEHTPFEFQIPGLREQPSQGRIYLNVIQSDAAINPGNSGGALINSAGELIGINVAIASPGQQSGNIGLGFAIPVDYAKRIAQDLIEHGQATHATLGVMVTPESATGNQQDARANSFTIGARIEEVQEDTPAHRAGLKQGDVITKVNDQRIGDSASLTATIRQFRDNDTAQITLLRDGSEETVRVDFSR